MTRDWTDVTPNMVRKIYRVQTSTKPKTWRRTDLYNLPTGCSLFTEWTLNPYGYRQVGDQIACNYAGHEGIHYMVANIPREVWI